MTQSSYPTVKIDLSNLMIDNLKLDNVPHMPKDYLNRWVFWAKAHPGKLTIGEREIPIKYISVRAEIEQKYIDEDIIQEIFPTPEERAQLVHGSKGSVKKC